jgi:hypothetical protein
MHPSGNKKGSLQGSCPIPVYVFLILILPLLLLAFDFIALLIPRSGLVQHHKFDRLARS